jgi:hypothetical protein
MDRVIRGNIEALSLEEIEHSWQTTGLSAVSVAQAVIKPMLQWYAHVLKNNAISILSDLHSLNLIELLSRHHL